MQWFFWEVLMKTLPPLLNSSRHPRRLTLTVDIDAPQGVVYPGIFCDSCRNGRVSAYNEYHNVTKWTMVRSLCRPIVFCDSSVVTVPTALHLKQHPKRVGESIKGPEPWGSCSPSLWRSRRSCWTLFRSLARWCGAGQSGSWLMASRRCDRADWTCVVCKMHHIRSVQHHLRSKNSL